MSIGTWKVAGPVSEEFIDIVNNGTEPVSLEGWTLDNGSDDPYVFPPGAVVEPESSARVHARCGLDLLADQSFFWCHDDNEAFDEASGQAVLIDPTGAVRDEQTYQS